MTLVAGVSLVFVVMLGVAVYFLWRAHRRLARLEQDIVALTSGLEQSGEEWATLLAEVSGSRILVEIINPMTLARSRSRWGAALVGVAPRMVRRRVYENIAREMKRRLEDNEVEVHLEIFHPTGS